MNCFKSYRYCILSALIEIKKQQEIEKQEKEERQQQEQLDLEYKMKESMYLKSIIVMRVIFFRFPNQN